MPPLRQRQQLLPLLLQLLTRSHQPRREARAVRLTMRMSSFLGKMPSPLLQMMLRLQLSAHWNRRRQPPTRISLCAKKGTDKLLKASLMDLYR